MKNCCCDLCGSKNYLSFPQIISRPLRVVICRKCSLIYTNPCWDEREIQDVYDKVFKDDPGAPANCQKPDLTAYRQERFEKALGVVQDFVLPMLCEYVNPSGKKWLDVRFRAGALPVKLFEMGAEIHGVDIFEANVDWLKIKLPTAIIHRQDVHNLLESAAVDLDVISMVTTHVPAHVPSPTKLFSTAFEKLVPGGILFVNEKDITKISQTISLFPFQYPSGMAHYHHLTFNTAKAFVRKAGFEILYADYIKTYTAQKHFLIVAQKPLNTFTPPIEAVSEKTRSTQIYTDLLRKYLRIRYRQKSKAVLKRIKKALTSKT